jgi:formylglycine-generating enzyme
MVDIPKGVFCMGAQAHDIQHFKNEFPIHKVEISIPFSMGVFPVTQCLWNSLMPENPSAHVMMTAPVEQVSWCDALLFCNRLSIQEDLEPVYSLPMNFVETLEKQKPNISRSSKVDSLSKKVSWNRHANGYRLPTEAEWEYAAKGSSFDVFPGGDDCERFAWYKNNSANRLQPIGQKDSNFRGLYDMSGNVNEWCFDAVNHKYFNELYANRVDKENKDPVFFDSSVEERVRRGGSWKLDMKNIRISYRGKDKASTKKSDVGFRLVRTLHS